MKFEKGALKGIKVALIFPPYKESSDTISFKAAKQNLGVIPPLSLLTVAAILEAVSAKVIIIDASALNLNKERVVEELNKFGPDFIGYTLSTYQFHYTLEWIKYIKRFVSAPVIVGGLHLSYYPVETFFQKEIDYGIIGEAEYTLPALLTAINDRNALAQIRGIIYRDNGQVCINQKNEWVQDLDQSPMPARHLLDNRKYYSLISSKRNFTAMITSRGCPYRCYFCDNNTIKYRCRSPEKIVDEMEICKKELDVNEVDIFDALFSIDRDRVLSVCAEIKRRRLKINWSFRTRVNLVDEEMLGRLHGAGCVRIYYGIESAVPEILRNINKEIDLDTVRRVIIMTKEKGIGTFGYFMFGCPGETKVTIEQTINFMLSLPLDHVQISPQYYTPNSVLYEKVKKETGRDFWAEYTLSGGRGESLPRIGTKLTNEEIECYIRKAYLKFYLRLKHVIKSAGNIKNFYDFSKAVRAIWDMLLS